MKRETRGKLFVINKNVFVNHSWLDFEAGATEVENRSKKKKRPMK